jgi:alginate O-acetyltransferase complex protein AlgI
MLFNSYTFIVFLVIVLVLHNATRLPWNIKKINLLLASYIFYAVWNPPFVLLLWLSTIVDFVVGKKLYNTENKIRRRGLLIISLAVNLGMLGFFKYGGFLLDNFLLLMASVGVEYKAAAPDIILPVGISFYTFQTLCYTLDMYKRRITPEKSLLDFSLFVTFFPQLVAGPIVRPAQLLPQFKQPHTADAQQFLKGLFLLSLGLFMKVVMADGMLAASADSVFGAAQSLSAIDAWLGVLAFSGQIFFDFAGYSTCAIGIAACIGFTLPDNFRYPYAAVGFSDFWKRWHITLSAWLRDYLYIGIGGNRSGALRTYINLMITMLLGGLWHGASWTFVAWGALHGTYLCVERLVTRKKLKGGQEPEPVLSIPEPSGMITRSASFAPAFFQQKKVKLFFAALLTFFLVNVTWVFFRAGDFATAWRLLQSMFGVTDGVAVLPTINMIKVSVVTVLLFATHWVMRDTTVMQVAERTKWWVVGLVWSFLLISLVLSQKSSDSFIYFQF